MSSPGMSPGLVRRHRRSARPRAGWRDAARVSADGALRSKSNLWIAGMADADIRGLDIGMLRAFDALLRERSV